MKAGATEAAGNVATFVPPGEQVVLDPRDPLNSARVLISRRFTADGQRTLHHYRGVFYEWTGTCYREAGHDAMKASVWDFLGAAQRQKSDKLAPFQPNRSRVGDVTAALAAACNLPAHTEIPAWLDDTDRLPAGELLPVRQRALTPANW